MAFVVDLLAMSKTKESIVLPKLQRLLKSSQRSLLIMSLPANLQAAILIILLV